MLKFMDSADTSNYLLDFIDHTRALDESRDQDIRDYCPVIYEFINDWAKENGTRF